MCFILWWPVLHTCVYLSMWFRCVFYFDDLFCVLVCIYVCDLGVFSIMMTCFAYLSTTRKIHCNQKRGFHLSEPPQNPYHPQTILLQYKIHHPNITSSLKHLHWVDILSGTFSYDTLLAHCIFIRHIFLWHTMTLCFWYLLYQVQLPLFTPYTIAKLV